CKRRFEEHRAILVVIKVVDEQAGNGLIVAALAIDPTNCHESFTPRLLSCVHIILGNRPEVRSSSTLVSHVLLRSIRQGRDSTRDDVTRGCSSNVGYFQWPIPRGASRLAEIVLEYPGWLSSLQLGGRTRSSA